MQYIDISMLICKDVGKLEIPITYVTNRKCYDMHYTMELAKIHNELGCMPDTKFYDVIKKTIKWYLEN